MADQIIINQPNQKRQLLTYIILVALTILICWALFSKSCNPPITQTPVPPRDSIEQASTINEDSFKLIHQQDVKTIDSLKSHIAVINTDRAKLKREKQVKWIEYTANPTPETENEYEKVDSSLDANCDEQLLVRDGVITAQSRLLSAKDSLYEKQKQLTQIALDRGDAIQLDFNKANKRIKRTQVATRFFKIAIPAAFIGGVIAGVAASK